MSCIMLVVVAVLPVVRARWTRCRRIWRIACAVFGALPTNGAALDAARLERLGARSQADGEPWLGADPALAEVGVLDDRVASRASSCAGGAACGSRCSRRVETVTAARRDRRSTPQTPPAVREQAIRALGDRELARQASRDALGARCGAVRRRGARQARRRRDQRGNVASEAAADARCATCSGRARSRRSRARRACGAARSSASRRRRSRACCSCASRTCRPCIALACCGSSRRRSAKRPCRCCSRARRGARRRRALEMLLLVVALAGESALGTLEDALSRISPARICARAREVAPAAPRRRADDREPCASRARPR